jgi:hypothetical protein
MMNIETRISELEANLGLAPKRFYRAWRFETAEPSRRLACYKDKEEITEAEYMVATGSTFTNVELEAFCGQRPLSELTPESRTKVEEMLARHTAPAG